MVENHNHRKLTFFLFLVVVFMFTVLYILYLPSGSYYTTQHHPLRLVNELSFKQSANCTHRTDESKSKLLNITGNSSNNHRTDVHQTVGLKVGDMVVANRHVLSPPSYGDPRFLGGCSLSTRRATLFHLLKWWIAFSEKHGIIWWLTYGTLIGAMRHHDMVPWDGDADIAVMQQYEPLIRRLSTPRKSLNASMVNLVTRPGPHCPYNGKRTDCKGNNVKSQVDGCAFCGPLARVFYTSGTRLDLYLVDIEFDQNGIMKVFDEGLFEYTNKHGLHPVDWYFPLRKCSFMGLTVTCPRKSITVLNNYYFDIRSRYKCVRKKWKKIKSKKHL